MNSWRVWSTLSGSVLLHAGFLALVLLAPPEADLHHSAPRPGSPFGESVGREAPTSVRVEVAPAAAAEAIVVELDESSRQSESPEPNEPPDDPRTEPALPEQEPEARSPRPPGPSPDDIESPEAPPGTASGATRKAPRAPNAPSSSAAAAAPAEPEAANDAEQSAEPPDTEGEDWLRIEDQLASSPADRPQQATPPTQAVDPMIERLLAAEARKARARRNEVAQHQASRSAPRLAAPPAAPSESVPDSSFNGVTDVPVGLARWLSRQAYTAPEWDHVALGQRRIRLRVTLRDGYIESYETLQGSPKLSRAIEPAFVPMRRRRFPGGDVHPASGEVEIEIAVRIRQLSAKNARPGAQGLGQHTTADGRYLPTFHVLRPSLRQIVGEVSVAR